MNIVILGAGRVGRALAEQLVGESDLTLVDTEGERLREIQSRLDVRTVLGGASHPKTLRAAGCEDAEIVVAVTANDEANLVACKICGLLFQTPTKIARVRASALSSEARLLGGEGFGIDHVFCPEQIVADIVVNSISHPGCIGAYSFARGRASLAVIRVSPGAPTANRTVREVRRLAGKSDFRIVGIYREGSLVRPGGDSEILPGDEAFVVAAEEQIGDALAAITGAEKRPRRVFIAGGGNIGLRAAAALESTAEVKVAERDRRRCAHISSVLERALVLKGIATDERLLQDEGAGEADVFCAVTNDDEENIMSALLAKRLGARQVAALLNRAGYADIVGGDKIDIAVSPSQLTVGSVLTHIRKGDVSAVHSLGHGSAEAIEVAVHGDARNSKIVGRRVRDIAWPAGVMPGVLWREEGDDGSIVVAHDETVIEDGDRLIVFAPNREAVRQLEKLLRVGLFFA